MEKRDCNFSGTGIAAPDAKLELAARIAVQEALRVKAGEQVLIISNPQRDAALISMALYDAALEAGGKPLLVYQPCKSQMDFAEAGVIAAFDALPEAVISISAGKLGKDKKGIAAPYSYGGKSYDHIFHLRQYGEKNCRAFWSPSVTAESFARTVPIDYALLKRRCAGIGDILDEAVSARVSAPGGTDIVIGLAGRKAKSDDGDFSAAGSGGNLPAGETFISPQNGTAEGVIVFDGSISLHDRDIIIRTPIKCVVEKGFVREITGGREAYELRETVTLAARNACRFEREGGIPAGLGEVYAKNANAIGELGIGLNPEARVSGNMLEDEKAFHTCHFAIGQNYDEDAPSLIHLDGLVKAPTIVALMPDGNERVIEHNGILVCDEPPEQRHIKK
ncbi:MAG: peptidase M17 [Spirochaetaceae bacterium]|jgi:leucyl aminopeptidase (aminopeptidase T)|nr:peptidase M17 [Spirochaetaceae bacterium]